MSGQSDNTIRLEGRYGSSTDVPEPLTLRCNLVTYRDAAFKETKGPDGSVIQSMVEQPSLMVSGLPTGFNPAMGDWTHIVSSLLPDGQGELRSIMPLGSDRARFVIKFGS